MPNILNAWGGRASDGILDNLLPGDVIMTDTGFNIGDTVSVYYAEVVIPNFTKGIKQLDP